MMMAIIMPYMPRIPAITTGMIDLKIRSGLSAAVSTMPSPALAVPNAAPAFEKIIAAAIPKAPNPIAWLGSPKFYTPVKSYVSSFDILLIKEKKLYYISIK